ncbi:MAG: hypothetical protein KDD45_14715 [Bdellovibrionales bacterium]|nr:hypothetical protein [Bdellovibrionales bacterium]
MKNLIISSIIALLACNSAMASKIGLDARTDFQTYSSNEAAGKPAYSVFRINRLRVDFQGSLGESNTFRFRFDPLKVDSATTKSTRDSVSSYTNFAFITHKLSDDWSFSMGKIITGMGGVEAMNNPADVYLTSVTGTDSAAIYWPVGAQVQGMFGDHKLIFNVANITEDVKTGSDLSSTSQLYGLTYMGKLADGMVLPNLSYHTESYKNGSLVKVDKTYLAVGAKILVSDFEIELDYLNNHKKYDPQSTQVIDNLSAVGLLRYKMETGSVHFKYENSAVKTATNSTDSDKTAITGMTLAYEFKPVKEENWRAHIALTQKDTKPDGADTKTEKIMYVGTRILADFLKQ